MLWSPTSSAIDLIYLFVNFPNSLFRIAFADSVLETKTCVSPKRLVLKQFPYLSHDGSQDPLGRKRKFYELFHRFVKVLSHGS